MKTLRLFQPFSVIMTSVALFVTIMIAPAVSASSDQSTTRAQTGSQFINPVGGIAIDARATNVAIQAQDRCRYIDSDFGERVFVPTNSPFEWESFIVNAPGYISLGQCRHAHSITHDFADPVLTAAQRLTNDPGVTNFGAGRYSETDVVSGSFTRVYDYPLARSASLSDIHMNVVGYQRRDCRPNVNARGALRDPAELCSVAMWTETGRLRITFIPPTGMPRALSNDRGEWVAYPESKLGAPPAFLPPENRTCPPRQHDERYWIDHRTHSRAADAAECPFGPGTQRYQRTEQLEYHCFDGTAEPTGGTRFTPWVLSGGTCEEQPPPPPPSSGDWTVGTWGSCSASCGGGVRTRAVSCAYDSCSGPQPAASETCNSQACPTIGPWTVGAWGACSASCGGGTRTRTVSCDFDSCTGAQPATSEACNSQACQSGDCGQCGGTCTGPAYCWYDDLSSAYIDRTCGQMQRAMTDSICGSPICVLDEQCNSSCPQGYTDVIPAGACNQWDVRLLNECVPVDEICRYL